MTGLLREHELYTKFKHKWARTRDAIEGGDAIRAKTVQYLPALDGQSDDEYRAYAMRPEFYDATARTAEALAGLVFGRPLTVDAPEALVPLLDDIDYSGKNLEEFARFLVDENLATGRGVIVVNHNGNPEDPGTLLEPKGRPYLTYYPAESILDWRVRSTGGRKELVYLKVRECVTQPGVDEFSETTQDQFRVFDLDPLGNYRQRVFIEVDGVDRNGKPIKVAEQKSIATPVINGTSWKFLPLVLVTLSSDVNPGPVPLLPIADTNISHFRTQADLEHGAHFCGLPTPWVAGVRLAENEKVTLGSSQCLVFEAAEASAGFLQPNADTFAVLEKLADRKEHHMAALGARMLTPETSQMPESGFALSIRSSGENGALARVATSVSAALSKALQYMAQWLNLAEDDFKSCSVKLNSQFVDSQLAAPEITALMAAWQSGGISHDTFLYNMQRGGRLPDGRTVEDEQELIEQSPPPLGMMGDPLADPNADPAADPNADPARNDNPPAKPASKSKRKAASKDKAA